MGTHHTHLVNEDDDDEDAEDEDVYMYPTDMHPDERDAYRSVVRASKASDWECEQHENIVGSKRKTGESSTSIPSTMRKSQSMRHSHQSPPIAPSLYKSSAARQKNIKDIFKGGAIKETMGRLISKFFIYESVAPSKAKSHHFKNMIIGAQQAGMGIEPPSPYEIKNKYLEMEYREMKVYVNQQREKWKTYGCTIMSNGWTGPMKLIQIRKYCGGDIVRPGATRRGVGSDSELLQVVHDVFAKLDPTTELLGQFGNEMQKEDSVIERQLQQGQPWCPAKVTQYGDRNDRVAEKDYLDLLDISVEVGEEEDNQLFQWAALNSHQEIDSTSAGHSSRPNTAGPSASGYDGSRGGTDDGGDNGGGDIDERQHSQYPIN
ncbi:hypothetical protein CK203_099601 [Vitis vinifera]|uniref:DUF659 domain-containing protein n=1 Tax=Vitis vinifera TaxID=29760 RepID=A0A438E925_VITVI|nr:hypothetical protein CK203_099601 [Vitis vinifera]